jgi:hypothetical protein
MVIYKIVKMDKGCKGKNDPDSGLNLSMRPPSAPILIIRVNSAVPRSIFFIIRTYFNSSTFRSSRIIRPASVRNTA